MDERLAQHLLAEVSNLFSFLVEDYRFSPPQLEIDSKIDFACVAFTGRNLAIEFILDQRESDLTCKIARVINGETSKAYAVDGHGVLVRDYLSSLLKRRGINVEFTNVGKLPVQEMITVTLGDFARMLRQYGGDILADSTTALDE